MTPANAPTSRSPSIAMLTTPTCSDTTPERAPKMSGVEIATVDTRVEVRVTTPAEPEPAYTRNARIVPIPARAIPRMSSQRGFLTRIEVVTIDQTATSATRASSTQRMPAPPRTISGISKACALSVRRIVTSPFAVKEKKASRSVARV